MNDRVRPPEPPPPSPDELAATAALAHQAHQVAGQLRLLSERMNDLGWRTDNYDLAEVASTIAGMSVRAAMHSGDTDVLNEVTGKPWKLLGGDAQ